MLRFGAGRQTIDGGPTALELLTGLDRFANRARELAQAVEETVWHQQAQQQGQQQAQQRHQQWEQLQGRGGDLYEADGTEETNGSLSANSAAARVAAAHAAATGAAAPLVSGPAAGPGPPPQARGLSALWSDQQAGTRAAEYNPKLASLLQSLDAHLGKWAHELTNFLGQVKACRAFKM